MINPGILYFVNFFLLFMIVLFSIFLFYLNFFFVLSYLYEWDLFIFSFLSFYYIHPSPEKTRSYLFQSIFLYTYVHKVRNSSGSMNSTHECQQGEERSVFIHENCKIYEQKIKLKKNIHVCFYGEEYIAYCGNTPRGK